MKLLDKGGLSPAVRIWSVALLVAIVTFIVYLPSLNNEFVNWDDEEYVYKNLNIRQLDLDFFRWIFQFHKANWHPLTWLSHAIDYQIWGLNPMGHHLSSIILHSMNTFLVSILTVLLILRVKLSESSFPKTNEGLFTRAIIAGGVTALLFGIHPLHVESVAWVAERKDVLSTFFVLLSLIFYVNYVIRQESSKQSLYYSASLIFFILALMSKPMAVTLPVILVILDIYPFQRFSFRKGIKEQQGVIIEKIPFFFFSVISTILTIMAQHAGGAIKSFEMYPLYNRIAVAIKGLFFYLEKMVFPSKLSPYYPYPKDVSFLSPEYMISIIAVVTISLFCVLSWKRGKKIFSAVWVYYVVTLLPILGIIQIGKQAAADRYTYIPSIGIFLLTGIGISIIIERIKNSPYPLMRNKMIFPIPLVLLFCLMGALTVKQIEIWKNSIVLWSSVIKRFPDDAVAYINRANAYLIKGNYRESIKDFDMAIKLNPSYPPAYLNRALAYKRLGKREEALSDLNRVIEINPQYSEGYNNRGLIYRALGDYKSAIKDFSMAIELHSGYSALYFNRAGVYFELGDYKNALKDLDKAIELEPKDIVAYINRCRVHNLAANYQQGIYDCSKAIKMDPRNAEAYRNRGLAYYALGKFVEAVADYGKVINLGSKDFEIYYARGIANKKRGENLMAILDFTKAIELNPKLLDAYINRGIAYGEIGQFENSIKDFTKAIELNPKDASAYYNRGATYYRLGKKKEALRDFQRAGRLGNEEIQRILKARGISW